MLELAESQEFNAGQRAAFCVYSGKGVTDLREFLSDLFTTITDEITTGEGTEYDEDFDMDVVDDGDEEDDEEEEAMPPQNHPNVVVSRGGYRTTNHPHRRHGPAGTPPNHHNQQHAHRYTTMTRELMMTRDRGSQPIARTSPHGWTPAQNTSNGTIVAAPQRGRGFGHQPIIEASTSPAPSDAASNRSSGTNGSSGTAFFRNYPEAGASSSLRQGVTTPDLIYAEIGHGRGTGPTAMAGPVMVPAPVRRPAESAFVVGPTLPFGSATYTLGGKPILPPPGPSMSLPNPFLDGSDIRRRRHNPFYEPPTEESSGPASASSSSEGNEQEHGLADSNDSYPRSPPSGGLGEGWSAVLRDIHRRARSQSPTPRELQESVESALGQQGAWTDVDGRGRSGKRAFRNTISVAEQYASSFFFGRGSNGSPHESASGGGPSNSRDSDPHGH